MIRKKRGYKGVYKNAGDDGLLHIKFHSCHVRFFHNAEPVFLRMPWLKQSFLEGLFKFQKWFTTCS